MLDADISKCFDCINQERLLEKLNTYPTLRRQIRAWLKAGVMDGKDLDPTSEGTPQGAVLSPLLANVALHGMENRIKEFARTLDLKTKYGWQRGWIDKERGLSLIRYADDFVILHKDLTVVQRCREIIAEWLKDMGLELKPSKTRLTHTLNEIGSEPPGFDFLGFNIRQYKVGKYTSGKSNGKLLGFKTIITPSKQSQKNHYSQMADLIEKHKGATQAALISRLNPVICGWGNYFKTVASQGVFQKLDHLTYYKLKKWGKYRHSQKGNKWIANKYWQTIGGDNWVFATRQEGKNPSRLQKHSEIKIQRHVKVKGEASPYDGNLVYGSVRMGKHPEMPKRTASLLKKQEGRCPHCGLFLRDGDAIELDHIIPKSRGGRDEYKNWQLLHRHGHDEKTRYDRVSHRKSSVKLIKHPENYRWENDILVTY